MLKRYQKSEDGKRRKLAQIYTKDEHAISPKKIAPEAVSVIRRLSRAGYDAYIVGGAIRDLLIGVSPKDYDIATDARPRSVRRLFRRSRIIGKRFQLVHVYVQNHIIEVSTFRGTSASLEGREANNLFGTMAEDVKRRDFTMNALYYDPNREQIIDYVGGFEDIRQRRIKSLVAAEGSFDDDPVRMIRALRYASTTGFKVPVKISRAVRRMSIRLKDCSTSRLTEELFKILSCGASAQFIRYAREHGLLEYLLPELWKQTDEEKANNMLERLEANDIHINASDGDERAAMVSAICEPFVSIDPELEPDAEAVASEIFRSCKSILAPLTPPNAVVGGAVRLIMTERGMILPVKRKRRPRQRRVRP